MGRRFFEPNKNPISDPNLEWLNYLPHVTYKRGDKGSDMFYQWFKVATGCRYPDSPFWPVYGKLGISMEAEWLDFDKFKADMGPSFDDSPWKPLNMQRRFLSRRDTGKTGRLGFTKSNTVWVERADALHHQSNTLFLETPFGKRMTLKEIAKYLKEHEGEEWPDGREYSLTVRELDEFDRLVTVTKPVSTICALLPEELRRRYKKGLRDPELFAPTRPYGKSEEIRESASWDFHEDRGNQIWKERLAKAEAARKANGIVQSEPEPDPDIGF